MLNNSINILNFDGSIIKQKKLLSLYKNKTFDLSDIAPIARNWLNSNTRSVIQSRLKNLSKDSVTFLGSGDFHHVSEILISRFEEPLSIISFDYHPDWTILPGVSSSDISSFIIRTGDLDSFKSNRLEIYPYTHGPSRAFLKKVPVNVLVRTRKGKLFDRVSWNELKGKDLRSFFYELLKRIPVKKVYVSVDKDC